MVADAEANAADDKKFEEMITARNTGDGLLHATRKALTEAGEKLTEEDKAPVEAAASELEEALKGDDKSEIEAKTQALSEAQAKIAEKLYAAQPEGETPEAEENTSSDDDVVDAEFEEVKDDK